MRILVTGGLGHIGSALCPYLESKGHEVVSVDLEFRGNKTPHVKNMLFSYDRLIRQELGDYNYIVHLAGHSSVAACKESPAASMDNNCLNFFHLVNRIAHNTRIIYASSASVYGSCEIPCKEDQAFTMPLTDYDMQKQLVDRFMYGSGKCFYGLRFGTVCGISPNVRNDLLINKMVETAKTSGKIKVTSGENSRGVLGIKDLCRAVEAIINQGGPAGYYNLASFNDTIHKIGYGVSELMGCSLNGTFKGEDAYSFALDTTKFRTLYDFHFKETLESIVGDLNATT